MLKIENSNLSDQQYREPLEARLERSLEESQDGRVVDGPVFMATLRQIYFNPDI